MIISREDIRWTKCKKGRFLSNLIAWNEQLNLTAWQFHANLVLIYHHMYIGYDNSWVAAVLAFFTGQVVKPKCLVYLHHVLLSSCNNHIMEIFLLKMISFLSKKVDISGTENLGCGSGGFRCRFRRFRFRICFSFRQNVVTSFVAMPPTWNQLPKLSASVYLLKSILRH